jgi:predicted aspartyl protease
MDITFVKVKVSNPAKRKNAATHEFLVDSGAIYSVLPARDLKALGIKPESTEEFILANGETIQNPVGNAFFEFNGTIGAAPVIFGGEGVYLLGTTTLAALGFILDPINRVLKALPMVLMGLNSSTCYCRKSSSISFRRIRCA